MLFCRSMISPFNSLIVLALRSGFLLPPYSAWISMLCTAMWAAPE